LQPYISSDSHHPNPTQTERIYRAFLFGTRLALMHTITVLKKVGDMMIKEGQMMNKEDTKMK